MLSARCRAIWTSSDFWERDHSTIRLLTLWLKKSSTKNGESKYEKCKYLSLLLLRSSIKLYLQIGFCLFDIWVFGSKQCHIIPTYVSQVSLRSVLILCLLGNCNSLLFFSGTKNSLFNIFRYIHSFASSLEYISFRGYRNN